MGLPGHRRTSSDKRRRAAHFALTEDSLNHCPKCQKPVKPHHACSFCGTYKNRTVVNKTKKITAATKKHIHPAK